MKTCVGCKNLLIDFEIDACGGCYGGGHPQILCFKKVFNLEGVKECNNWREALIRGVDCIHYEEFVPPAPDLTMFFCFTRECDNTTLAAEGSKKPLCLDCQA